MSPPLVLLTSFRSKMTAAGFTISGKDHPICPVMLGDARLAAVMAEDMLSRGERGRELWLQARFSMESMPGGATTTIIPPPERFLHEICSFCTLQLQISSWSFLEGRGFSMSPSELGSRSPLKSSSPCFLPRYLRHWLQLPRGPQGESPHPGPDFGCAQRRGHRPLRGGLHRGGTETRSAALRGHQRRLSLGALPCP